MNNNNLDKHDLKSLINLRMKEFNDVKKKQQIISMLLWLIVIIVLTAGFYSVIMPYDATVRGFITAFLCAIVLVNWIINLPFLLLMFLIVIRTKSRNFLSQFIPQIGLQVMITVVSLTNFVELKEDSPYMPVYIIILLLIIILEMVSLALYMRTLKENKKPIFFWTFLQDSFEAYSSTLLSQQALTINELQDGYSQRPFFKKIESLKAHFVSPEEFTTKISEYMLFLLERSEIIDWTIDEGKITFYPRVLIGNMNKGLGIKYLWEILVKVYKRKGLTKITIDYNEFEMSLVIAEDDYKLLNDVTYHILGQQILERFELSMSAFFDEKIEESYKILFPLE